MSRCELCELVLIEIYILLRNPATSAKPLRAAEATRKIQNLRENPAWALLDYPGTLMDEIWRHAASLERYRGIFDVRFALTLRYHGVKRFATVNIRDFKSFEI